MCMIKPQNKEEMLSVSGVGEHKYAKYGQQFLEAVNQNVLKCGVVFEKNIKNNQKAT